MGELFGWPNGVVGMISGVLAGALVIIQAVRTAPWDIHDENSYAEPKRLTVAVVTPPVVLFITLLTMLLGLGAIDRALPSWYGLIGDIIGLIAVPFGVAHLMGVLK